MSEIKTHARAVSDVVDGRVVASVELAVGPERVFQALASRDVIDWWVNPGVFDTREWTGDVRPGGRWRAAGGGALPALREARPMRWRASSSRSTRRENWSRPGTGREHPARHRR